MAAGFALRLKIAGQGIEFNMMYGICAEILGSHGLLLPDMIHRIRIPVYHLPRQYLTRWVLTARERLKFTTK